MVMNFIISFFILSILFGLALGDTIPLEIGKNVTGKIEDSKEPDYYTFSINENPNNSDIVINLYPKDEMENFCDPDLFVSIDNQRSNLSNSNWNSTSYGRDIVIIPANYATKNKTFFIGVLAYSKCSYQLSVNFLMEIEILSSNNIFVSKGVNFLGYFWNNDTTSSSVLISTRTFALADYRLYVGINKIPSSDLNQYKGEPAWFEGQYVKIFKNDKEFCTNCKYWVLITSEESLFVPLRLEYFISGKNIQQINNNWSMLGLVNSIEPSCYSYEINESFKKENIILSLTMFSGSLNKLYVSPWKIIGINNLTNAKLNYKLHEEEVIKITPEVRNDNNINTGNIYLCFESNRFYSTSFIFRLFPESSVEDFQRGNYIINGVSLNGYLPADKVTKYMVIDFSTNANITLKLETVSGSPILFASTDENYQIYRKPDIESNKEKLLKADTIGNIQTIQIHSRDNPCHQNNTLALKPNFRCAVNAIILCNGTIECVYRISDKSRKTYNMLKEHKIENHIIPFNTTDYYRFFIENDSEIENVTIILNSINGDADLFSSRTHLRPTFNNSDQSSTLPGFSPDINVYSKSDSANKSVSGYYYVAVYSYSYTYYSIMYYTSKSMQNNNKTNDTVTTLVNGMFFKDFLTPTKNFKIYKFNTIFEENNKKDIDIILSREKGYYEMFLYDDISKINYQTGNISNNNNISFPNFTGYLLNSNHYYPQILLNKTNKFYKSKATFYLVVYLSFYFSSQDQNALYSVAFKSEDTHFILNEGLPINYFINNPLHSVSFVYYHYKSNDSLLLGVSNSYGNLKFYYDFNDFKQNMENATNSTIVVDHYQVPSKYIDEKCKGKVKCPIFIGFKTTNVWGDHFSLIAKPMNKRPMMYTSGIIQNNNLFVDEVHYYYIRVGKKEKGIISVGFNDGRLITFMNILPPSKTNQTYRKWDYPTSDHYKYLSENSFYGQNIVISDSDLIDCEPQCILLVGIKGVGMYRSSIKYSFKYISKISNILDNQPMIGNLIEGETQFYSFYANENVKNIYISVNSNNPGGDSDIFVSYGQIFPSKFKNDWNSLTSYSEFIDINKDDSFFTTVRSTINNSNYTIGIYGYSNTTYTLFVTTNPKKIISVGNYHSGSCVTKKQDDYCYFRYTDMYSTSKSSWVNPLDYLNEILVSSEFLYGNGTIYAKVYDSADINIYKDVPTKENYDFSSSDQNFRNFLKIDTNILKSKLKLNDTKYSILFSVYCNNPCFVTLNTDSKYNYNSIKYLTSYKENLVYVKNKTELLMVFYYYDNNNLTIQSGLLGGSGSFKLYANENNIKNTTLATYLLNAANSSDYQFISKNHNGQLYLNVKAGKDDLAFFVKLSNYQNWTNIPVGKSQKFVSQYYTDFLAYFYFPKIYEGITINLHPMNHNTAATMSANIVKVDKSKAIKNLFIAPNPDNAEFTVNTDYNLQSGVLQINNTWKDFNDKDNIVCLISIRFSHYFFNITNNSIIDPFINSTNSSTLFTLTVSSLQNSMSLIQLSPNLAYTSVLDYVPGKFDIYDLTPTNSDNNILIIELYTCQGNIHYKLSEKVTIEGTSKEEETKAYTINNFKGKKVLTTKVNAGVNHYLKVYIDPCINAKCPKNVMYMVRYSTGLSVDMISYLPYAGNLLSWNNIDSKNINISWSQMMKVKLEDPNYVSQNTDANYTVFYSSKKQDYELMESVCYLVQNTKREFGHTNLTHLNVELESNKIYYINVLANLPENQQYAYSPIEIINTGKEFSILVPILGLILIILFGFALFYLYSKYSSTKKRLDYEMQDVRNMASISKSDEQVNDIQKKRQTSKYATLTEEGNMTKI